MIIDFLKLDLEEELPKPMWKLTSELQQQINARVEEILRFAGVTDENRTHSPWWAHLEAQKIMGERQWHHVEIYAFGDKCVLFGPVIFESALSKPEVENYRLKVTREYCVVSKP